MKFKEKTEKLLCDFPWVHTDFIPSVCLWKQGDFDSGALCYLTAEANRKMFLFIHEINWSRDVVCGVSWIFTEPLTVRFKGHVARGAGFKQANIKKHTQTKWQRQSPAFWEETTSAVLHFSVSKSHKKDQNMSWYIFFTTCWWKVRWSSVKSKNLLA